MDLEARCLGGRRFGSLPEHERANWLAFWKLDCMRRKWWPIEEV